jgi:hypothetical protein
MKRSLATALLIASALALPALAEDAAKPKMDQGAQTQTDTNTTASTNADANFGSVISAIQAGKSSATSIQGLTTVSNVKVVKVSDLAKGNSMEAFDNAVSKNQADITNLQTAIGANAALKAKLNEQSITAADIVAANVEADGSVTVYVK